jgi:hypothetical protein
MCTHLVTTLSVGMWVSVRTGVREAKPCGAGGIAAWFEVIIHLCLVSGGEAPIAHPIQRRYIANCRDATIDADRSADSGRSNHESESPVAVGMR